MSALSDIDVTTLDGQTKKMGNFLGKATLVVNVASKCGFTPQYAGLEALYRQYKERGLSVLGFPCDQFGHQEPGDAQEIRSFCSLNYEVTFPLFAKIDVNGANTHPVYQQLKAQAPGIFGSRKVKWNFTKFLIDADGNVVKRFAPVTKPEVLTAEVAALLSANGS
jgi:glutathione peroxidase